LAEITEIIFDTCSLVNLMNGNQLDSILSIREIKFFIGPAVYGEVSKVENQKLIIDNAIEQGRLIEWEGELDFDLLNTIYEEYGLGDGETESIAIAISKACSICCDDKKARNAAKNELSQSIIIGSLGMLKMAVMDNIIKCTDATLSYLEMILKGGFLPKDLDGNYFCNA
jgi:predicted nucleic acid-binding protein